MCPPTHRQIDIPCALALSAALVALGSCRKPVGRTDQADPGAPPVPIRTASARALRPFVQTLAFAARSGDEIASGNSRVRVEPVAGLQRYSTAALVRGRVIGRLLNLGTDSAPPVRVAPGDTVLVYADSAARGWRAVYYSLRVGRLVAEVPLTFDRGHTSPRPAPWAQFTALSDSSAAGPGQWFHGCGYDGCCRTHVAALNYGQ